MRELAVVLLALLGAGCGGQTTGPTPASVDAAGQVDGEAACAPGEQLCNVCGTVGCYAGGCPMHSCVQATCPAELPNIGEVCSVEGALCGYTTDTNACGADNCYCQGGAWDCEPTCILVDAGGSDVDTTCRAGQALCPTCSGTACQELSVLGDCPPVGPCAPTEPPGDVSGCPAGENLCIMTCSGDAACVVGECPPIGPCLGPPPPPPSDASLSDRSDAGDAIEGSDAACPAGEALCDVGCAPSDRPHCAELSDLGLCPPAPPCL